MSEKESTQTKRSGFFIKALNITFCDEETDLLALVEKDGNLGWYKKVVDRQLSPQDLFYGRELRDVFEWEKIKFIEETKQEL